MVFPVVPLVTELLRNDERLLFLSASKVQKVFQHVLVVSVVDDGDGEMMEEQSV